jgi:hypothetical protein
MPVHRRLLSENSEGRETLCDQENDGHCKSEETTGLDRDVQSTIEVVSRGLLITVSQVRS